MDFFNNKKWSHLQFKLHQQLIQICDPLRLPDPNKCNRLKVWNNRLQKAARQNIFPPSFFPSPSLAPLCTRSMSLNEMQRAITHYPIKWSRHLTICTALRSIMCQGSQWALNSWTALHNRVAPRFTPRHQRQRRAGGEPGRRLRVIVVVCGWQGETRSGHWQQQRLRLQHPGASAIRIHNAGLVIWKGSRSCSSTPFWIIHYMASSSLTPPHLTLPPTDPVTHDWINSSCSSPHSYLPSIVALTSCYLPLHKTSTPPPSPIILDWPSWSVSQWWPVAIWPLRAQSAGAPDEEQGQLPTTSHFNSGCPDDCVCQAATPRQPGSGLITDN